MATSFDPLRIRRLLGKPQWGPPRPHGPDGWAFVRAEGTGAVIVTCSDYGGDDWIHASISKPHSMPDYHDLKHLHQAVFGDRWAYQVFTPPADHVNIHEYVLHLWGRLDGKPALPDFTFGTGSI